MTWTNTGGGHDLAEDSARQGNLEGVCNHGTLQLPTDDDGENYFQISLTSHCILILIMHVTHHS